MVQFMKDKPTKWGFKLWVVTNVSGYTIDLNIYTGKAEEFSECGLAIDIVMRLVEPFWFQGYESFCDNFYTSPTLFQNLLKVGIHATGILRTNQRGVSDSIVIVEIKLFLQSKTIHCGVGFYYRECDSTSV